MPTEQEVETEVKVEPVVEDETTDENEIEEEEEEKETPKSLDKDNELTEDLYNDVVEKLKKTQEELDKFKHFNRKLETEKAKLTAQVVKSKVAKEFGLSEEAEELLEGKNEDQLRVKAEKLQKLLGITEKSTPSKPRPNLLQGLTSDKVEKDTDDGEFVRNKLNKKYNPSN